MLIPPRIPRRESSRHRTRARLAAALALMGAAGLVPGSAQALQVGGSLGWDLSRSEAQTAFSTVTQERFGQNYRVNLAGYALQPRLATWRFGTGWRNDRTYFSGTSQSDREVTLKDVDLGLVLLPATLPMTLNFRRSIVDSEGEATASQSTLSSTISFGTQVPMRDGNPLGVSAYQTTLDPGTGTSTSRLFSLSKRFDLGDRSQLSSAYQFSQFDTPAAKSTGHGVSVSNHTRWNERVASNAFANVSTRSTTSTRLAGGRSLFLNNSFGGSLSYQRGREVTGNLAYTFTESPQDQAADIRSHLLSAHGKVRLDKKTDVNSRFTARRLDLGDVTLDTATMSVGLTYRPRFGWSTGGQAGLSKNRTSGPTTSDRDTYSGNVFFNARHDLEPVQINWGGNAAYATSRGDFSQDRLTTNAQFGVTERRLRWIRLTGGYRFTDIQETNPANEELDPFTQEHGLRFTGNVLPFRGLLLPTDVLSGSISTGVRWSRQFQADRNIRSADLSLEGKYLPFSSLITTVGYEVHDNSSDLAGADQVFRGSAAWSRRAFRRGSMRLSGDVRRNYTGGSFQSQEATARFSYDYLVGLLRISLSADATFVDLGGAGAGTESNNVRLNIVRTF